MMNELSKHQGSYAAIDVGEKRVGIALASKAARLPRPFATLINNVKIWNRLDKIFAENAVDTVVIGLPQNQDGKDTRQTKSVKDFAKQLENELGVSVQWQDEALSSKRAESELNARGKRFNKEDVDALAATLILEDYLKDESVWNL